mgnify:CR=1 FL=1
MKTSLLGTALAPIVLVWLAEIWGWREAFFMAGVPGLILAVLIWRMIDEPMLQGKRCSS